MLAIQLDTHHCICSVGYFTKRRLGLTSFDFEIYTFRQIKIRLPAAVSRLRLRPRPVFRLILCSAYNYRPAKNDVDS